MTEPAHSALGASGAHIWFPCPGSVPLIERSPIEEGPNPPADEGTAAHEFSELCFREDTDAWVHAGTHRTVNGADYEMDAEMEEGVQLYLDTVRGDMAKAPLGDSGPGGVFETYTEYRVGMPSLHKELWGTADKITVFPHSKLVRIYDLKYGQWVPVKAEGNLQGLCYGAYSLEEILEKHPDLDEIEIVIVQSRRQDGEPTVQRWRQKIDQVGEWVQVDLAAAASRVDKARQANDLEPWLLVGDHCRFCDAKAFCPAKQAEAEETVEEMEADDGAVSELEGWELAAKAEKFPALKKYMDAVMAEIKTRVLKGGDVPGYKAVKAKADRVWKESVEAQVRDELDDDAWTEPKLKSPAQIEKVYGTRGKDFAKRWAFKPDNGLTVAPEDDRRAAVKVQTTAEVFKDV